MKYFNQIAAFCLLILHSTSPVFGGTNIIQKRLVNETDIISKEPFTTMTSCYMKCSSRNDCSSVGFSTDPTVGRASKCLLLKNVEKYGIEEKEGLLALFVMIDVSIKNTFDCTYYSCS